MAENIVEVENLSKLYKLGAIGTGTISHDLNRWWSAVRKKTDPYQAAGQINNRASGTATGYVWSLKDINFQIKQGEIFGVIGSNGAGKSTLLKIISKITKPTTGEIRIGGRIASLLEVGTGFHPELTGRENVFLNGAILGMRKQEIRNRFDEIIAFSGVEKYIDTPVKKYSSGMYVRLAFAVAAHLEPDILIIDEVLAVGDAEFQAKCLGKMKDVSANQGRTVLFVSHNIAAIRQLCQQAVLLEHGLQKKTGPIAEVIAAYQHETADTAGGRRGKIPQNTKGYFTHWQIETTATDAPHTCYTGDDCLFSFGFHALEGFKNCEVRFMLRHNELLVLHASNLSNNGVNFSIEPGQHLFQFRLNLPVRDAKLEVEAFFLSFSQPVDTWQSSTKLTILDNLSTPVYNGVINPYTEFSMVTQKAPQPLDATAISE